ncbi:MAG: cysteine--tRNA ligase [Candidatus Norongarragalinales archaeon]
MLKLFNSLSLKKENFKPLHGKSVSLYSCGPTVYNYAHLGNFRAYLFYDLLRRWLKHEGYALRSVMNITNVDDKTIRGSHEQGKTLKEFTGFYEQAFFQDLNALGIMPCDYYPRATDFVPQMIQLTEKLLDKGYAYEGEDGSVYYKISKFKRYGKLSHLNLEKLKAGGSGRVGEDEYTKENVRDFALWKAWTSDDRMVFWDSPFGRGRPGWHIECSAMSMHYLGESFDIHTGGVDLKFPHHENEIAQSEAATGKRFAKYWLHNEHLFVEGRKMSKRFNNFYTLRDVLAKGYSAKAVRLLLLSTHYRSQLNFTFKALDHAENTVKKLSEFAFRLKSASGGEGDASLDKVLVQTKNDFALALNDDLDVANALAAVFDFVKEFNKAIDKNKLSAVQAKSALEFLRELDSVFGVVDWNASQEVSLGKEVEKLVQEREKARKARDFKKADEIRALLKAKGIVLEDTAKGVVWKKA